MRAAVAVLAEALSRLAIARGAVLDEVTLTVYTDGLEDIAPEMVSRACRQFERTPRREFETALPDVGTLRQAAERLAREDVEQTRLKALPAHGHDHREPTFFCLSCRDESSGWRPFRCPGQPRDVSCKGFLYGSIVDCGKRQEHAAHPYVARCECWQNNPVVERRKQWATKKASAA